MLKQEKLSELKTRLEKIDELFLDQNLIKDQNKYKEISKERSEIAEVLDCYDKYNTILSKIDETNKLLKEPDHEEDFIELANEELSDL